MARTIYKNKNGLRLPGVTTITGVLNKPQLVAWANRLGLEGVDSSRYVDDLADVGSLAHQMIQSRYTHEEIDFSKYSPVDIERANNCVKSFDNWAKDKTLEPILVEAPLVSETHQYGGKPDWYGKVNGVLTLLDFKTGSGIYEEHLVQVAGGYGLLLEEHGHPYTCVTILNIPRRKTETFDIKSIEYFEHYQNIFKHCLAIYQIRKAIK